MTYEIPDNDAAIEQFEAMLDEHGFTSPAEPGRVARTLDEAAELDYDMLNQHWSDWNDNNISEGLSPVSASGWDWED